MGRVINAIVSVDEHEWFEDQEPVFFAPVMKC
jgi:hypothetical protein